MILFISNPIYFLKNLVLCLIQLFDFESLLDFYIILEIINSHTIFFYWTFFIFPYVARVNLLVDLNKRDGVGTEVIHLHPI